MRKKSEKPTAIGYALLIYILVSLVVLLTGRVVIFLVLAIAGVAVVSLCCAFKMWATSIDDDEELPWE